MTKKEFWMLRSGDVVVFKKKGRKAVFEEFALHGDWGYFRFMDTKRRTIASFHSIDSIVGKGDKNENEL